MLKISQQTMTPKHLALQTRQEYADVSVRRMQMQDETMHSSLKIKR